MFSLKYHRLLELGRASGSYKKRNSISGKKKLSENYLTEILSQP
jgi:hypothetical protein